MDNEAKSASAKKPFSLADIEAAVAGPDAVPFEPLDEGRPSGVRLMVYSDQNPTVIAKLNEIENNARRAAQVLAAEMATAKPGEVIAKTEDEQDMFYRRASARLAGWDPATLSDPFSEANAIRLISLVPTWGAQIIKKSRELGTFTKASPQA